MLPCGSTVTELHPSAVHTAPKVPASTCLKPTARHWMSSLESARSCTTSAVAEQLLLGPDEWAGDLVRKPACCCANNRTRVAGGVGEHISLPDDR